MNKKDMPTYREKMKRANDAMDDYVRYPDIPVKDICKKFGITQHIFYKHLNSRPDIDTRHKPAIDTGMLLTLYRSEIAKQKRMAKRKEVMLLKREDDVEKRENIRKVFRTVEGIEDKEKVPRLLPLTKEHLDLHAKRVMDDDESDYYIRYEDKVNKPFDPIWYDENDKDSHREGPEVEPIYDPDIPAYPTRPDEYDIDPWKKRRDIIKNQQMKSQEEYQKELINSFTNLFNEFKC